MEVVGNIIDVSTMTVNLDFGLDFWVPEAGIVGQCKSISRAENLVAAPTDHVYAASGQYLDDLFSAQAELLEARKKAADQLRQYIELLRSGNHWRTIEIATAIPFEQLLEFFDRQCQFAFTPPKGILSLLLDGLHIRNLLRQVFSRTTIVWRAITHGAPRFCAVSWAKRSWFLMHGIRPPRTWTIFRPVFECAPL
jgi:hypothetical protein